MSEEEKELVVILQEKSKKDPEFMDLSVREIIDEVKGNTDLENTEIREVVESWKEVCKFTKVFPV